MATIRALIIGDDATARRRVRGALAVHDDIEVVGEQGSSTGADPDLVRVDVERRAAVRHRFVVRNRDHIAFVKAALVEWISAEGNYARLHTAGHSHLIRESLQRLEAHLDPAVFVRIHRSAIINIDHVARLKTCADGAWSIVLNDGTTIPLGPTFRDRLEAVLGQKL